jgi:hypothetical protein
MAKQSETPMKWSDSLARELLLRFIGSDIDISAGKL